MVFFIDFIDDGVGFYMGFVSQGCDCFNKKKNNSLTPSITSIKKYIQLLKLGSKKHSFFIRFFSFFFFSFFFPFLGR